MPLNSTHPFYDQFIEDWTTMRDLYRGERLVKSKGEQYLPPTKSMRLDGMGFGDYGYEAYKAYKLRAVFPDYIKDAVEHFIGLMHQKPANISLPAVMEPLRMSATTYGEPLQLLLRRINEEQLITGRLGLLLDLPVNPELNQLPYIAMYVAESIRNWDDGAIDEGRTQLNLVVLDESGIKRQSDGFEWTTQDKYRVLMLGELLENEPEGAAVYQVGVFNETNEFNPAQMLTPLVRGQVLNQIPFVFINTKDIVSIPDEAPLMGLGRQALTVYRSEADYRQNLFMQGQDTLVIVGSRTQPIDQLSTGKTAAPLRTGAGTMIEIESGGDAKYIGVNSQGLAEQRQALESDRQRATVRAGQIINSSGTNTESGTALQTRIGAQTATLNQIAQTGAAALEKLLKICAVWVGANPEDVKVEPNLEFANYDMTGQDAVQFMTARNMGAPLSLESIHKMFVDRGITSLDYETELARIADEGAGLVPPITGGDEQ